jgi:hypothetical protein
MAYVEVSGPRIDGYARKPLSACGSIVLRGGTMRCSLRA